MHDHLVGIGLRSPHLFQFIDEKPNIGWVEVHSENYLSLGGNDFEALLQIRKNYPISLHGIGMSLGSSSGVCHKHLSQLEDLIKDIDPFMISDHLSWSVNNGIFLPDLLPTPFNDESLEVFSRNISETQNRLKRQILLENPSTYFEFTESTYSEAEFLNILLTKTGAGMLLDVNNVYISSLNNGFSASQYIDDINPNFIKEIHVSGHSVKKVSENDALYIDSHDSKVSAPVWNLYKKSICKFGKVPSMIEWDVNIPKLSVILSEADKIKTYMDNATSKQDEPSQEVVCA